MAEKLQIIESTNPTLAADSIASASLKEQLEWAEALVKGGVLSGTSSLRTAGDVLAVVNMARDFKVPFTVMAKSLTRIPGRGGKADTIETMRKDTLQLAAAMGMQHIILNNGGPCQIFEDKNKMIWNSGLCQYPPEGFDIDSKTVKFNYVLDDNKDRIPLDEEGNEWVPIFRYSRDILKTIFAEKYKGANSDKFQAAAEILVGKFQYKNTLTDTKLFTLDANGGVIKSPVSGFKKEVAYDKVLEKCGRFDAPTFREVLNLRTTVEFNYNGQKAIHSYTLRQAIESGFRAMKVSVKDTIKKGNYELDNPELGCYTEEGAWFTDPIKMVFYKAYNDGITLHYGGVFAMLRPAEDVMELRESGRIVD